jgi:hypothetical protein
MSPRGRRRLAAAIATLFGLALLCAQATAQAGIEGSGAPVAQAGIQGSGAPVAMSGIQGSGAPVA